MFERFNENARRALFFARYEAGQLGGIAICPEHVLLGVIRLSAGQASGAVADRILALSHLSPEQLLQQIEKRTVTGAKVATSVDIPFSDQTKQVLRLALEEAGQLQQLAIGPEHLLLGILAEGQSMAAAVLTVGRLSLATARQEVLGPL